MTGRRSLTVLTALCRDAVELPATVRIEVAAARQSALRDTDQTRTEAETVTSADTSATSETSESAYTAAMSESVRSAQQHSPKLTGTEEKNADSNNRQDSSNSATTKPSNTPQWRKRLLRKRSGVGQMLVFQLAALIGITAIVAPQILRAQRNVINLTSEARTIQFNLAERQRLNSAIGAFARNITVPPRCANPPSEPFYNPPPTSTPTTTSTIPPVSSKECATWDPTPQLPTLWKTDGINHIYNGNKPEKETCFIADAQVGNNTPTTNVNIDRWRQVLKCVQWYSPIHPSNNDVHYGYVDSTATSDNPGTLIVSEYPEDNSDRSKPFDPASPRFLQCQSWADTGCNQQVFDNIAAVRMFWLDSEGEWLDQPEENIPSSLVDNPTKFSRYQIPHAGTKISRVMIYMCPVKQDRRSGNHMPTLFRQSLPDWDGSDCVSTILNNDPTAVAAIISPYATPLDPVPWAGYDGTPDELEDDLVAAGANEAVWRFELKF